MDLRVLYIEDDEPSAVLLRAALESRERPAFRVSHVGTLSGAMQILERDTFDALILDLGLPDSEGLDTIDRVRAAAPDTPIVVFTSTEFEEVGVAALHHGGDEFLEKRDLQPDLLVRLILFAIERRRLLMEVAAQQAFARVAETDRNRLAEAVSQVDDLVIITDVAGVIEYVNGAFERITGYSRAEAVGARPALLRSDVTQPSIYDDLWATLDGGKTWRGRFVNRRKDGSVYIQASVISPIRGGHGETVGYVGLGRDVTLETKIESELRQSQKLQALGQLASGVAHDFNNTLAVIMTVAREVRDDLERSGGRNVADMEEIIEAAHRAEGVVARLLGFSRQASLRLSPVAVRDLLEGMSRMVRAVLPSSVSLDLDVEAGVPDVLGDVHALEQVILNLVANARDAMPDGGGLSITARSVKVDETFRDMHPGASSGDYVCISVADTGVGIPPAVAEKIFEPFFTTKLEGKGTGLGLSLVRGLMEQHSGTVHVYSEPGEGTVFRLYLPVIKDRRRPERPRDTEFALGASEGVTVLLLEDDPSLQRASRRVLARQGYEVRVADDGLSGLEAYRAARGEIDVIVSDLMMPRMTGRQVLEALRREGDKVPFVLTSGYLEQGTDAARIQDPHTAYLSKPWTVEDLRRAIHKVLLGDAGLRAG